jgi:GntR family transcriptional regulator/MocR family aminotransferase
LKRRTIAELDAHLDYGEVSGNSALREAIAAHVQQFRGITTDPDNVIVVEGTLAALRLAADVLMNEGDAVLIEDPGYPLAQAIFVTRNMRLVPVNVDADGLQTHSAPAARLAYVTPSHQFPLGAALTVERRHQLLDWAVDRDA